MNLYKNVLQIHISLVIDATLATLASGNPLRFRKNLLEKIYHEKLWEDYKWKTAIGINRKPAKVLALSSGKIDKYDYYTTKEILPSDQRTS